MESGDVAHEFYPSEIADHSGGRCAGRLDGIREHLNEKTAGQI
jgi:hypothetical protein